MKSNQVIVFTLLMGVLFSCGSTVKDSGYIESNVPATQSTIENIEVEEAINELPTKRQKYWATETVYTDLVHTKLEVSFDWKKSYMHGVETLTAKPHFYPSDSLILDAKGMEIHSIKLNGKALDYTYSNDILKVNLDRTYTNKEKYTIVIDYTAKPDERKTGGSAAITSDKGLYFINPTGEDENKMPHIWTQGETESSSVWFPTIDAPNVKTTQEIFMTVDDKYATLSNGKFIGSKKNSNNTRTDHWKQELPHAPYLFMMGVGEFKVVKDYYTKQNGEKMDVFYYVEPEWEEYAKPIFGETPAMIDFFSKRLGIEYPWDKYHQIVVRDYVSGAMENTGAVVFGDYVYKNKRELLDDNDQSTIAHELFHHWFGDLVTCESWSNLSLNESFANYSQYLWDEHRYGKDQADYYAEIEADGYFQSAMMGGYHDLIWFDYDDKEQMFDGHSYNKGGRILHMLRDYLGDDAFFTALNKYLNDNKFKAAEFHHLRLAFEEVCGEDLNWFFDQWYLGSGHPILEYNQTIVEGKVQLTISQKQNLELSPIYKLPITVAVFDDKGKNLHKIILDELEETFEFPVNGTFKCIIPDFNQVLLSKSRDNKLSKEYVSYYYLGENYRARELGLKMGTKRIDSLSQQMIIDALDDSFWNIRKIAIEKAGKCKGGFAELATNKIRNLVSNDPNSQVRAACLAYIDNVIGTEAESIYTKVIAEDSSYSVVVAALNNLGNINSNESLMLAKKLENEKSSKMKAGIAGIYSNYGSDKEFDFFQTILGGSQLQGFDELGVMNDFSYYLSRMDVKLIDNSYPVYDYLSKKGGFYTKMFLPQNLEFIIGQLDNKLLDFEEELKAYEENNDAQYAAEVRKSIESVKNTKKLYTTLLATNTEEKEK